MYKHKLTSSLVLFSFVCKLVLVEGQYMGECQTHTECHGCWGEINWPVVGHAGDDCGFGYGDIGGSFKVVGTQRFRSLIRKIQLRCSPEDGFPNRKRFCEQWLLRHHHIEILLLRLCELERCLLNFKHQTQLRLQR